jgi:type VI secretion system protein ImpM
MPSVDNVGRYFPLTLAVLIEQQTVLPRLFLSGAEWFEKLEALALSALEDNFDLEDFDGELQSLVLAPAMPREDLHFDIDRPEGEDGWPVFQAGICELDQIRDAFIDLSARLLGRVSPVYSLWCTSGSERVRPSLSAWAGLPPPSAFVEFLAGDTWHKEQQNGEVSEMLATRTGPKPFDAEIQLDATARIALRKWRSNACSNTGKVRKINEDSYLERPEIGLWAVADGMGGHKGGQAASKAVVDALNAVPKASDIEQLTRNVSSRLHKVNADLLEMGQSLGEDVIVGSTVVAMMADGKRCAALWAGDSRLYRYRNGSLEQLTRDHSLIDELSSQGQVSRAQLAEEGLGSVITRALGAEPSLIIDKLTWEVGEKDIFILCSDGLVREVGNDQIADILSRTDIEQSSRALVDAALAAGARDNVTVIVVYAGD